MIGVGEVLTITGLTAIIIGPAGMPRFARQVGNVLGRTMGFLKKSRSSIASFSRENQLTDLHDELQAGIKDVSRIRQEWYQMTQATNLTDALFNPGTHGTNDTGHAGASSPSKVSTTGEPQTDEPGNAIKHQVVSENIASAAHENTSHAREDVGRTTTSPNIIGSAQSGGAKYFINTMPPIRKERKPE